MFNEIINFFQTTYKTTDFIPLHAPKFIGNEKKYLNDCIDSTFVSSVGQYVDSFEKKIASYTGAKYAIATSNGTSALHMSLILAGVNKNTEVLTQALTFVATCNAISYCNARPIFIDVDQETLGFSPDSLKNFLNENTELIDGKCINKTSRKVIRACVPMHTFGHPCKIDEIKKICDEYHISLIEDAAESLGSFFKGKHTGTFGEMGIFSFNGNKIVTSGGGGCIITDNELIARKAKHLTTTAKMPHKWKYTHDSVAYNYRLPNINAALLVAQLENLDFFLENKRILANHYIKFFNSKGISIIKEPRNSSSNYWLNALLLNSKKERDEFLEITNKNNVMTRPVWTLMNELAMYKESRSINIENSVYLADRIVNIPSSVRI